MNTDNFNTSTAEVTKQQEQISAEQMRTNQQFGRMPERHKASYTEKYHYHYLDNEEAPDERED